MRHHHSVPVISFDHVIMIIVGKTIHYLCQRHREPRRGKHGQRLHVIQILTIKPILFQQYRHKQILLPEIPDSQPVRGNLQSVSHRLASNPETLSSFLRVGRFPNGNLISPTTSNIRHHITFSHDIHRPFRQGSKRVDILPDKTDLDGGLHRRGQLEQRGTDQHIRVILPHVSIQTLLHDRRLFLFFHLDQQISEVRFWPERRACQIIAQGRSPDRYRHVHHLILLQQISLNIRHHILRFPNTEPFRQETICPEIRFIHTREKILWHNPHDIHGHQEQTDHRDNRDHLMLDQSP